MPWDAAPAALPKPLPARLYATVSDPVPDPSVPDLTQHQSGLVAGALDAGYGAWAGVELIEMRDGAARISFRVRPEMLTPWRTLNGGVISSLVEIPSFLALAPSLADDELPVTNDIFVQHMRPLPGDAAYQITGRVIRRGASMAWTEVEVAAGGRTVSLARITKTLLRRPG
jgi:uncharacterized protein (TIGR00369 family)